ncbi:MAG: Mth938-like domain-containing protein [Gemmobacter sp.]
MPSLDEIAYSGPPPVDGYGPGFFRIAGKVHRGALAVLPGGVAPWAGPADPAPFLAVAGLIDVLFVGTGPEIAPLPAPFRTALEEAGIGIETMSSAAACRSYNICLAEGRRIAAALIPV